MHNEPVLTGFYLFKLATATKVDVTVKHQMCVMEISIIVDLKSRLTWCLAAKMISSLESLHFTENCQFPFVYQIFVKMAKYKHTVDDSTVTLPNHVSQWEFHLFSTLIPLILIQRHLFYIFVLQVC